MIDPKANFSRRDFLRTGTAAVATIAVASNELIAETVKSSSYDILNKRNNNKLSINKPASTGELGVNPYNGMGKVSLEKNIVSGVNRLTQDMIFQDNTIYVIKYDFILYENISIPAKCILEFDGGSIRGKYTIVGNNTVIKAEQVQIFNTDITLTGTWNVAELYPEWFGAKGDFNVFAKIGTDDSNAITKTIAVAEALNIRRIKFANVNYLVSHGIRINYGDVWLDGSGALLNESVGKNNELVSREGGLFCPQNTKIITFSPSICAPVRISNLQFFCYDGIDFPAYNRLNVTNNSIALNWTSEDKGPVWPFIVDYCHFEGFSKAILFSSSLDYCVNKVQISNTSFMYNYFCVKFDNEKNNCTSSFVFNNNCAHGNIMILDIKVCHGTCVVEDNNIEGDRLTTKANDNYVSKIVINDGSLSILRNYSEGNQKTILHLCPMGIVKASICNNTTAIHNGPSINRCDISYIASGVLFLDRCDIPLFIKEYPIFCSRLVLSTNIDVQINPETHGELTIYTTSPYYYTNDDYVKDKYELYYNEKGYNHRFVNGILTKKRDKVYADYQGKIVAPSLEIGKRTFVVVALYCPDGFVKEEETVSLLHPTEGIIVRTDNVGPQYKYCYSFVNRRTFRGNYYYLRENVTNQFFGSVRVTNYLIPSKLDVYMNCFNLSLRHNNIVGSVKYLTNSHQMVGDKVFDTTLNKELIWSGSSWVDYTGVAIN